MQIQIGDVVMDKDKKLIVYPNKTYKYLTPCLKKHGAKFVSRFNAVCKRAIGLGDMLFVEGKETTFEHHLFILLDSTVAKQHFNRFVEWIKEQDYYVDDYVYGDILKSQLHMVVIKLPEEYNTALSHFHKGQYSQMFSSQEDIDTLFENHPETKLVLLKDHNYRIKFVRELNREFNTTLKPEEYEGELDTPPNKKTEYFNT